MQRNNLVIGSQGSKLALWQAEFVRAELEAIGVEATIIKIKTHGDEIQNLSFDKIEEKSLLTKELENALLNKEIDLAVHVLKDISTSPVPGLALAGVSYREDPADVLIIRKDCFAVDQILNIKQSADVGTNSLRRKAYLQSFRNDLSLKDLQGDVPTRIEKLRSGAYDGIVLATAGINRLKLNLDDLILYPLSPKEFIPAPAQGVLAYQCRTEDTTTRKILQKIHHEEVSKVTNVERKLLNLMQGGSQFPLGVYCERDQMGNFHAYAALSKSLEEPLLRARLSSSTSQGLAESLFEKLQ